MSTKIIESRKDILLLLLFSPGTGDEPNEAVAGRTRLMKMLFIFKQELLPHLQRNVSITDENFYQFFAWKFGPFSKEVYDDLTFFELRGFVEQFQSKEDTLPESAEEWQEWLSSGGLAQEDEDVSEYEEPELRLTDKGQKFAHELFESLSPDQKRAIKTFKARIQRASLNAILKYVYETYKEFTDKSEIRDKILG